MTGRGNFLVAGVHSEYVTPRLAVQREDGGSPFNFENAKISVAAFGYDAPVAVQTFSFSHLGAVLFGLFNCSKGHFTSLTFRCWKR